MTDPKLLAEAVKRLQEDVSRGIDGPIVSSLTLADLQFVLDSLTRRNNEHEHDGSVSTYNAQILIDYLCTQETTENMPGREAEELRAGIETIIEDSSYSYTNTRDEIVKEHKDRLQDLLDRVDARDSLAYVKLQIRQTNPPKSLVLDAAAIEALQLDLGMTMSPSNEDPIHAECDARERLRSLLRQKML